MKKLFVSNPANTCWYTMTTARLGAGVLMLAGVSDDVGVLLLVGMKDVVGVLTLVSLSNKQLPRKHY